jgi:hypothetical protein
MSTGWIKWTVYPHIWAYWTFFGPLDVLDEHAFVSKSGTLSIELRGHTGDYTRKKFHVHLLFP